jgi:hypothetical protein
MLKQLLELPLGNSWPSITDRLRRTRLRIAEEADVESAVIGGLAALLGLILGRIWDRRSESSNWRRDQRTRCYEQLFASYYELRDCLRLLGAALPGTPESDGAVDRVLEVGARWQSNVAAVWLHGSEPVTKATKALDDQANALFMVARAEQLSWEEYRVKRMAAEGALEQLIAAVRHELGLPEFEVALRWRPEHHSRADTTSGIESGDPEALP